VIGGNDHAVVGEIPPSAGWVWLQLRHESRLTPEKRAVILDGKIEAALPLVDLLWSVSELRRAARNRVVPLLAYLSVISAPQATSAMPDAAESPKLPKLL
jgi:hypothetical protein